jgi:hypothetical protein
VGELERSSAVSLATLRWIVGGALVIALGVYLYGRYSAYVERDREITQCMHGHGSARAMCERTVDLRH